MTVKAQCVRGSTDDLGANRGHWGPNPQVWEQAVVQVAHTCLSFLLPYYHTKPTWSWYTEKDENFMTLVSFVEINLGRGGLVQSILHARRNRGHGCRCLNHHQRVSDV